MQLSAQAAEVELIDDEAAEADDAEADDDLLSEFEEAKRSRSLSSIFTGELTDDEVLQVDASAQDESLAVCC